jgi:hypothetical protein
LDVSTPDAVLDAIKFLLSVAEQHHDNHVAGRAGRMLALLNEKPIVPESPSEETASVWPPGIAVSLHPSEQAPWVIGPWPQKQEERKQEDPPTTKSLVDSIVAHIAGDPK